MPEPDQSDQLRIGNPERERAVTLLNDAMANGYLDVHEFDERVQATYTVTTRGELRTVLRGLPTADQLFSPSAAVATTPTSAAPQPIPIGWKTVQRTGAWDVAPWAQITGSVGTADLDFRQAVFHSHEIIIDIQISWSTVKLRVPGNVRVLHEQLVLSGMSSMKEKGDAPSDFGGQTIILRGSGSASTVIIRRG